MSASVPTTVLLLGESEATLALDRKMLRRLGVTRCIFFASGRDAMEHLLSGGSALSPMLICNERLGDMTGLQFLAAVRASQKTAHLPAVLLVNNGETPLALAARATNSCAVLARPYSPEQAAASLARANQPEALQAPLVLPSSFTDKFLGERRRANPDKPVIDRKGTTAPRIPGEAALREGIAALQRGDLQTAEKFLHGSYAADPNRVETSLALSRLSAFLHKGNEELMWLCRAGALCLKRGEKIRAATFFNRLPRGKAGQNPILAEAARLLQAGEARAAALTFLEAHRLDPNQPLHALIGRACIFTPAPEEHMRDLLAALVEAGHSATAMRLENRLMAAPREESSHRTGFLEQFPLLYDIVCVATHTFKTWRHAA